MNYGVRNNIETLAWRQRLVEAIMGEMVGKPNGWARPATAEEVAALAGMCEGEMNTDVKAGTVLLVISPWGPTEEAKAFICRAAKDGEGEEDYAWCRAPGAADDHGKWWGHNADDLVLFLY